MPFLKNIGHDLVEKRLWPIALLLVVALVAVPVLLGGGSSPTPAAGSTAALGGAAGSGQSPVSLDTTGGQERAYARGGKVRNPFKQPKVKSAGVPATTGTPTSGGGQSTAGSAGGGATTPGGTPGTTSPTTPGPGTTSPSPTRPDSLDTFRLTLRFGSAGNLRTIRDLARLSPLPSADSPFFVYLGVLQDAKTAVFLISSDVKATGDGKCRPSVSDCQTIEVKEGDTEFFDIAGSAHDVQYEMDLLHLDRTSATQKQMTAAAARTAAARHSKAGAAMLRQAHADQKSSFGGVDGYRWLPGRGVLTRVPAGAKASSAATGSRAAARALPGLPVWHAELTV
jgi:hypothetical protein